jgi:hypothetical protein
MIYRYSCSLKDREQTDTQAMAQGRSLDPAQSLVSIKNWIQYRKMKDVHIYSRGCNLH